MRTLTIFCLLGLLAACVDSASGIGETPASPDIRPDDPGAGPEDVFDPWDVTPPDVAPPEDEPLPEGFCGTEGAQRRCYTGPVETRSIGICRDGVQTCRDQRWGPCEGEILPEAEVCDGLDRNCNGIVDDGVRNACGTCGDPPPEICGDGLDNNCNGVIDEGCDCDGREQQPCFSGPPSALNFGECRGGVMDCQPDGTWGPCIGEILPQPEVCDGRDNDCDGVIDNGVRNSCGDCIGSEPDEVCDGRDTNCNGIVDDGLRVEPCGRCPQDISEFEICGNGFDDNCDGQPDSGCACDEESQPCFPGDPEFAGVGSCSWGVQFCGRGGEAWGACENFTLPAAFETCGNGQDDTCNGVIDDGCFCDAEEVCDGVDNNCDGHVDGGLRNRCGDCLDEVPDWEGDMGPEFCNGLDDNCNGLIDEGLLNACGNCDEWCYIATYADADAYADAECDGLNCGEFDDGIRLGQASLALPDLWIANAANDFQGGGTVTRIDTERDQVIATFSSYGRDPSRTAVDQEGNVWVANRAFATNNGDTLHQGSIVQILRDCPCTGDCRDLSAEMRAQCIRGPIPIGAPNDWVRGLAIDANGFVWAGTFNNPRLFKVDPDRLEVVETFTSPVAVYGIAPDADGLLWLASISASNAFGCFDSERLAPCTPLGRIDLSNSDVVRHNGASNRLEPYGIVVDFDGNIWAGNWQGRALVRLDRESIFTPGGRPRIDIYNRPQDGLDQARGVAVDPDNNIWMAWTTGNRVSKFDSQTRQFVGSYETCSNPIGVGVAVGGGIWTMCHGSAQARVFRERPGQEPDSVTLPTGGSPYSYSDMTGFQLRNIISRQGTWTTVFDCGYDNCKFDEVLWDSELPEGTTVAVRVRTRESAEAPWSTRSEAILESPAVLPSSLPRGRQLEVQFTLSTQSREVTPVLRDIDIRWQRP